MKRILFLLVLTTGIFSNGLAEEVQQPQQSESVFSAGAGLLITDKPQKGGDTEIRPIPLIFYRLDRFVFSGFKFSYYFIYDDGLALSLIGMPRFEGYDDEESRTLNGMHDREWTYELGMELSKNFDWGTLSTIVLGDVLGEHKGQEIQFKYKQAFDDILNISNLKMTPSVGANWRSKQLNDYYYGVEGTEATATRPEYHAGSTVGILAGLRLDYPIGKQWNIFGSVNVEWLGSEVTDSPIVNEHTMTSFLIGAMYQF